MTESFVCAGSNSSDTVLTIKLPTAPWALSVDASSTAKDVLTLSGDGSSKNLTVTIGVTATGKHHTSKQQYSFAIPAAATEFELRLLVDEIILEAFVAKGLAAGTSGLKTLDAGGAALSIRATSGSVLVETAEAWAMGCAYPSGGIA